ncbi:MAG TPA: DinB family protein [Anaerolineae bacterium]|nr:DinB family protein [Anaerolineae bacterium]
MPLILDELIEHPARVNQRAQELEWGELLYEYEHALDDEAALLAGLSDGQLHFKPALKSFSISEVITHALNSDQLFWRWVKLLAEGRRAEIDPAALVPGGGAQLDRSGAEISALLEAVRLMARGTIELRPDPIDLHSTTPHPYFGELNAKGWVGFMRLHHGLHLLQCEAMIDTPGFPRGASRQSLTAEEYLQPRDRKPWLTQEAESKTQTAKKPVSESKRKTAANKPVKKKPAGQKKHSGKKTTAKR